MALILYACMHSETSTEVSDSRILILTHFKLGKWMLKVQDWGKHIAAATVSEF